MPHRPDALASWLPRFADRTVLVLGDVMLDRYVLGEVRRISPEAPIPVLRATRRREVAGGAGNVAVNAASLGARAILVGLAGADADGAALAALFAETRVTPRLVPGRRTTVKTRFIAGGHQLLRVDEEEPDPATPAAETALLAAFRDALGAADVAVLSDYAKGVLTDRVLAGAIEAARAAGVPVVADPKRLTFEAYAGVTVLTPNLLEAARATGLPVESDAQAAAAAAVALAQSGAGALLLKRADRGLTLVRPGADPLHIPTRAVEVADVSGAGDTLVTGFALMLACAAPMAEAAALANAAAGVVVGKHGTAAVTPQELAAALHHPGQIASGLQAIDDKVVELDAALQQIATWREQGLRVGFTNGCFDLIHPGHVRLLARARDLCDRLVVGLNSDASVQRLKGPDRPVQNETARATVMASMASADLVVLFAEDTPERLIEAIRPDVLIKGADYRIDQVVGADFVLAHGGQVELIPLEQGHSTSATIRRISAEKGA